MVSRTFSRSPSASRMAGAARHCAATASNLESWVAIIRSSTIDTWRGTSRCWYRFHPISNVFKIQFLWFGLKQWKSPAVENHQFTLTLGGNIKSMFRFVSVTHFSILFCSHIVPRRSTWSLLWSTAFVSSIVRMLSPMPDKRLPFGAGSIPPSYGKSLGLVYDIGSATIFCSSPPPRPPGPIWDPCLCRFRPTKAQVWTSRRNARNFLENYDPIKSVMSSKYFGVEADMSNKNGRIPGQLNYLSISIHIYPYLSISIHIYPYLLSIIIYPYLSYLSYLCPHTSPPFRPPGPHCTCACLEAIKASKCSTMRRPVLRRSSTHYNSKKKTERVLMGEWFCSSKWWKRLSIYSVLSSTFIHMSAKSFCPKKSEPHRVPPPRLAPPVKPVAPKMMTS